MPKRISKRANRTTWIYRGALLCAIALSLGGIAFAVFVTKSANDAPRGGALAVAESFIILIYSRNIGAQIRQMLNERLPARIEKLRQEGADVAELESQLRESRPATLAKVPEKSEHDQKVQNFYLVVSSVVGTISWGFADIPARYLIHYLAHLHDVWV